jgi:hypothetical protein
MGPSVSCSSCAAVVPGNSCVLRSSSSNSCLPNFAAPGASLLSNSAVEFLPTAFLLLQNIKAILPSRATAPIVAPIPIPAFAPLLKLVLLLFVGDGVEVFEDVELVEEVMELVLELDAEDVVEDEELDVELVDEENVFASTLVLDVNVTPTGSSVPTLPFGSSATSCA